MPVGDGEIWFRAKVSDNSSSASAFGYPSPVPESSFVLRVSEGPDTGGSFRVDVLAGTDVARARSRLRY